MDISITPTEQNPNEEFNVSVASHDGHNQRRYTVAVVATRVENAPLLATFLRIEHPTKGDSVPPLVEKLVLHTKTGSITGYIRSEIERLQKASTKK
jgi:hypothetical protein